MRIISKTFQARALSMPVVVVNLLEFKQKPLVSGPKSLENGWELFVTMFTMFLLYYYVLSPRIDKLLPAGKVNLPLTQNEKTDMSTGEEFDIGKWTYDLGQKIWRAPRKWVEGAAKRLKDNGFIQ